MPLSLLNPWLIVAILASLVAASGIGYKLGADSIRADLYAEQQKLEQQAQEHQKQINAVAMAYGESLQTSLDTASKLREKVNDHRNQLADCSGRFALLNSQFVRLRNEAYQLRAKARDSAEPADSAAGTVTPEDVLNNDIENGQRWKQCRDQLNALIEVVR